MGLLTGKRALVSGVANGRSLAFGIAQAFQAHGASVALTCLPASHRRVTALAGALGAPAVISCDVRDDSHIARAFEQAGDVFGGTLDVFVHAIAAARLDDMTGEFIGVTREGWREALDVSAYSLVAMSRAARPLMTPAGGSILTLTFAGSSRVAPGYNMMGVAKAALESCVRYLAHDLGPQGIRVNALSPGPVATVSAMVVEGFDAALESARRHAPLRRGTSAKDVGDAAVFLASDLSRGVTGAVLPVDAGLGALLAFGEGRRTRASNPPRETA